MKEITEEATKRVDAIRHAIVVTKNQIADLQNQAKGLEQEVAVLLCPWEVGDRVIHTKWTLKGAAHTKGVVSSIHLWSGDYQVWVRHVRKDGSLSAEEFTVWHNKDLSLDENGGGE